MTEWQISGKVTHTHKRMHIWWRKNIYSHVYSINNNMKEKSYSNERGECIRQMINNTSI